MPMTPPGQNRFIATLHAFRDRPRITGALLIGLAVLLLLSAVPNGLRLSTRAIFVWDATAGSFIGLILSMMRDCDISKIKSRAAAQDEGQGLILALSTLAAVASILAIAAELSLAKDEHGLLKGLRVALAFATICVSWFSVHLIFAMHYAHEYYSPDAKSDGVRQGLSFPGGQDPDYWDFVHFAVIIGVASQTADIAFTSKTMRHTGTLHGILSFAFNTVVLALTINLVAGLF